MNPATRQAIGGTCSIIRQALITIEAIISAEESVQVSKNAVSRENQAGSGEEFRFTNDEEDDALAAVMGLDK